MSKKNIIILYSILIVFLAGVLVVLAINTNKENPASNTNLDILKQNLNQQNQNLNTNINNDEAELIENLNQQTEENDSAKINTYASESYDYSISYPSDATINSQYSETEFSQRGPAEDNTYIGGDTTFNADGLNVYLMIYQVSPNTTYDQFLADQDYRDVVRQENVVIDSINSRKVYTVATGDMAGTEAVITLVKSGNRMFVFNYSGRNMTSSQIASAEDIINSLNIN